jgi:DNA-binding transcriptional regulator YiaG
MTRSKLTGAELKAWREGIGRPRKWLAEQLGVSAKAVESWEYGTRNPGGPALRLIEQLMSDPGRKKAKETED